jgi:hypothetical protein
MNAEYDAQRSSADGWVSVDHPELVVRMTAAMREADKAFETVGGSTRHHVRECLLPILSDHGLRLILLPQPPKGATTLTPELEEALKNCPPLTDRELKELGSAVRDALSKDQPTGGQGE